MLVAGGAASAHWRAPPPRKGTPARRFRAAGGKPTVAARRALGERSSVGEVRDGSGVVDAVRSRSWRGSVPPRNSPVSSRSCGSRDKLSFWISRLEIRGPLEETGNKVGPMKMGKSPWVILVRGPPPPPHHPGGALKRSLEAHRTRKVANGVACSSRKARSRSCYATPCQRAQRIPCGGGVELARGKKVRPNLEQTALSAGATPVWRCGCAAMSGEQPEQTGGLLSKQLGTRTYWEDAHDRLAPQSHSSHRFITSTPKQH